MRLKRRELVALLLIAAGLGPGCGEVSIDRCLDVLCPLGQACDRDTGACQVVDPCAGVVCPSGAACDPGDGVCKGGLQDRCEGAVCTETQSCDPQSGACRDNPPPPSLQAMIIDRAGRPGISTVALNPFAQYRVNNVPEDTGVSQDRYNADGQPGRWLATWAPYLRFNLGLLDGLDGACGNQLLAGAAGPLRYAGLANLLALDALHVNTAQPACSAYLAVEVGAADCGGRRPGYDVVDSTYTLLVTGTIVTPVGDGVGQSAPASDTFPFLPPPR